MHYTVTGIRKKPDIGFRAATCPTAETAKERAVEFMAQGMRDVEIRDVAGVVHNADEFSCSSQQPDESEIGLADRLSTLT